MCPVLERGWSRHAGPHHKVRQTVLSQPDTNTVYIGSFHSCDVDVANPNHTFEHSAFASLGYLNDAKSRRAASCGMGATTQGIGPPERHKNPIAIRRNIREIWCWAGSRRVSENYRIYPRVRNG